jgi:ribosome biogenesis GTPase A
LRYRQIPSRISAVPRMKFQMINGKGSFCEDEVKNFIGGLPANEKLTVVSIIGSQSCGKSSLLNALFDTDFQILSSDKNQYFSNSMLFFFIFYFKEK